MSSKRNSEFHDEQRTRFVLRPGILDEAKADEIGQRLPADDPQDTLQSVQAGLSDGSFTLCDVIHPDGHKVGFTIYSIENRNGKNEFLSVASIGNAAENLTAEIIPILERIACENNCSTIRLHTLRRGLVQKLRKLDWFASEIVMRKKL
jgi:hypothetical protein